MNYNKAIEIANKIYWVGMYLENDPFQCHPYFIENGDESVLIDPGSMLEFDAVVRKINSISSMSNIKYIILHHQDPDLAACVPQMEKLIARDDLLVVTHSRMIPLIKHYIIESDYYAIDKNNLMLKSKDLLLKFETTPYCHSPGAFVTYEPKSKTLFSGDIFGGIEESWEFYASDDYFEQAKQFHEEYMPSRDIFNYALCKIEALDINIIAPQHGSIIKKDKIAKLISDMKALECGLYIEDGYKDELIDTIEELKKKDLELQKSHKALKQKDELLFQKAKMADMGEMIENIAHQWRQPLAINNTIISILKEKSQMGMLEQKDLLKKLQEMEDNIQYMSKTIGDFMNFFNPKKEKSDFLVSSVIESSFPIILPILKSLNIEIAFKDESTSKINGFKNEYAQVLIAILTNAKDVLISRKINNAKIQMFLYEDKGNVILNISDNGAGIKSEDMKRIFDPYFTTKHKSIGTGLGLYIAKTIIEQNMNGTLGVSNTKDGAMFTIVTKSCDETQ